MIEQAGPPSKQVQAAKQVQELIKDGDDAVIVGIFSSEHDAAFEIYIEACEYQETLSVVWRAASFKRCMAFRCPSGR